MNEVAYSKHIDMLSENVQLTYLYCSTLKRAWKQACDLVSSLCGVWFRFWFPSNKDSCTSVSVSSTILGSGHKAVNRTDLTNSDKTTLVNRIHLFLPWHDKKKRKLARGQTQGWQGTVVGAHVL